jgi:hypothetical protein
MDRRTRNNKRPRNNNSGPNSRVTVQYIPIEPEGKGIPVGTSMKTKTRRRLSNRNLANLIRERRGFNVSRRNNTKNDIIVGRAVAQAGEAYDNLDDMIQYIRLTAMDEGWSKNLLKRIIKKLKSTYEQYDENTRSNNTLIKEILIDVDEQFGDLETKIEYAHMLAAMYNWTDNFKQRVINAIINKYHPNLV